jgi:hypothetical protein
LVLAGLFWLLTSEVSTEQQVREQGQLQDLLLKLLRNDNIAS